MWGQPSDRGGFSPSFILGLVLIMFLLTVRARVPHNILAGHCPVAAALRRRFGTRYAAEQSVLFEQQHGYGQGTCRA